MRLPKTFSRLCWLGLTFLRLAVGNSQDAMQALNSASLFLLRLEQPGLTGYDDIILAILLDELAALR